MGRTAGHACCPSSPSPSLTPPLPCVGRPALGVAIHFATVSDSGGSDSTSSSLAPIALNTRGLGPFRGRLRRLFQRPISRLKHRDSGLRLRVASNAVCSAFAQPTEGGG